jgi:hypothetical protein
MKSPHRFQVELGVIEQGSVAVTARRAVYSNLELSACHCG